MKKYLLLALSVAVLLAAVFVTQSDDSSADICDDVKVYILNEDGTYTESVVNNVQTVRDAIDKARTEQGRQWELNLTHTNILSIDGRKPTGSDMYWRVFQWLPAGTSGWGVQSFSSSSDSKMVSHTTYCVTLSTISEKNGTIVYTTPNFEPTSTGYFFIRFANGYSPDNEHVQKVFTPEIREQGFWIEGQGSNMGAVLKDAIEKNWPGEIETYTGNAGGNDVADWINLLFGLGNQNLGDSVWAYWSQWCWDDHKWTYNNWTLGYYDPAVYPYMECIYLISTPDPYGDEYVIDKGGEEPNPDREAVVCMKNILTVDFKLSDGTLWSTQTVEYGQQADMSKVKEPTAEGMGFVGWGDTTATITTDTTFTATFTPVTPGMKCITYNTENGHLIRKEYVDPGSSAKYEGVPTKISTQQYDYVFRSWSSDLSNVSEDVTVTPVFDAILRSYDVTFYDYDRTLISVSPTKYGSAADLPAEPSRSPTVRYQYTFAGWSITPNNFVAVDLTNITNTTFVYAYYEPSSREYTMTFWEGGTQLGSHIAKYGSTIGDTYPLDIFKGSALAKMYRDADLTKEYTTNYIIVGDTNVYVSRVPGNYDAERDENGNMSGSEIVLSFTDGLARALTVTDGKVTVCDITQYPNGTRIVIGKDSLQVLASVLGNDTVAVLKVPRGALAMPMSSLLALVGDGNEVSFSVQNGPLNVKISSALKKINYSSFYRVDVRVDGASVMDLSDLGITADVSLLLELDASVHADVWNVTSHGATTHIEPSYDGSFATFTTSLLQFYAVGTTDEVSVKQTVVCPYGEVDYTNDGTGMDGFSKLNSMVLDNMGGILFVPSSFEGCTLRTMGPGALNGVVNAPTAVIPVTVSTFSWNNWTNTSIRNVYFLGDAPTFEGTVPAGITVHYRADADGWTDGYGKADLEIGTYEGSYRKDSFSFTFYVVDDVAVVHRYISGPYVQIPASVSLDGTSYPVSYIGDAAFMFSRDSDVVQLYQLKFATPYSLETLDLDSNIKGIQTRALYSSTIVNLYLSDTVEYIWDEAFSGCSSLANVTFDSLVFIGYEAFSACNGKAFTRFTVPDSVRSIGNNAFYQCSDLSTIILGKGITEIPSYCFGHCVKLTDLDIPSNVTYIADNAFYNCTGLQYVDLNNVTEVGKNAFYASGVSSLEFIVMGENLTVLGKNSFANNTSLSELEVHCQLFSSFADAFEGVDLNKVEIFASDNVLSSWSAYNAQPIDEPDPHKDERLLHAVEAGLIIFFLIVGIAAFYIKTKSYRAHPELKNGVHGNGKK